MKEDKNIPDSAKPDFNPQEPINEAVGTAYTPVSGGDPVEDGQAPEADNGNSLEHAPEEALKSDLIRDIEPTPDSPIDSETPLDQSSQVEVPDEHVSEGSTQEPVSEELTENSLSEELPEEGPDKPEAKTEKIPVSSEASESQTVDSDIKADQPTDAESVAPIDEGNKAEDPTPIDQGATAAPIIAEGEKESVTEPIDSAGEANNEAASSEEQAEEEEKGIEETPESAEANEPQIVEPDTKTDQAADAESVVPIEEGNKAEEPSPNDQVATASPEIADAENKSEAEPIDPEAQATEEGDKVEEPSPIDQAAASPEIADAENKSEAEPIDPEAQATEEGDKVEEPSPIDQAAASPEIAEAENKPTAEPIDSADQATNEATSSEEQADEKQDVTETKAEDKPEAKEPAKEIDPLEKYEREDYQEYGKEELLKVVDQVVKGSNIILADRVLNLVKPHYDRHRKAAKDKALEQFVADGNEAKDFDYKFDQLDHRFDADFRLIKDRKREYYKTLEQEKDQNLITKNELLEELRDLVHGEETKISMDALKSLQSRWKAVGQVPRAQVRTLWANYNALLDLFYDQRSIYFELKELDRRKNLEAKEELVQKAEQLEHEKNLKEAINQLNDLHNEYKHMGPVPKEVQEDLWQRFKAASDKIYARRKEFVKHLKEEQKGNLDLKKSLVEEVKTIAAFDSDRITDWNKQTNELLAVQKRWEAVGGIPKEYAKSVNKEFWSLFKQFFQHKNQFFKKLEKQRGENLIKKQELVERAQGLKDSTDWEKTAQQLKDIQQEWRNIGPVPEKQKKAIYDQFKSACDDFFNHRRGHQKELDVEYVENLKQKEAICMTAGANGTGKL